MEAAASAGFPALSWPSSSTKSIFLSENPFERRQDRLRRSRQRRTRHHSERRSPGRLRADCQAMLEDGLLLDDALTFDHLIEQCQRIEDLVNSAAS